MLRTRDLHSQPNSHHLIYHRSTRYGPATTHAGWALTYISPLLIRRAYRPARTDADDLSCDQ